MWNYAPVKPVDFWTVTRLFVLLVAVPVPFAQKVFRDCLLIPDFRAGQLYPALLLTRPKNTLAKRHIRQRDAGNNSSRAQAWLVAFA